MKFNYDENIVTIHVKWIKSPSQGFEQKSRHFVLQRIRLFPLSFPALPLLKTMTNTLMLIKGSLVHSNFNKLPVINVDLETLFCVTSDWSLDLINVTF